MSTTTETKPIEQSLRLFSEASRVWAERAAKLIMGINGAPEGPPLSKAVEAWDGFPREPDDPLYTGPGGEIYGPWGASWFNPDELTVPYETEVELAEIRRYCRWLAKANPFAQCGHENRQSYIIGEGFVYKACPKKDEDVPESDLEAVQKIVDEWLKVNKWAQRQQEIILRCDRDGEVFLRKFAGPDGIQRVRFVEPLAVRAPSGAQPHQAFGVETDPEDAETVVAYWITTNKLNPEPTSVPAEQVQHRKRNVDSACRRGMPLMFGVRGHLQRAVKNLRNISSASAIQTAIAMIRKQAQATEASVRQLVANNATAQTNPQTGRPEYVQTFQPGTILNATGNTEYEFPSQGMDPEKHIAGVQAELRAAAAALVMPEFMFTADASNANFASTMVAEGPCVKTMKRHQWYEVEDDRELLMSALQYAGVPDELLARITIDVQPPPVQVRDRYKDAQTAQILLGEKIVSPQTVSGEFGYEYDQEQDNIEDHNERLGLPPNGMPLIGPGLPGMPGADPNNPDPTNPDPGQQPPEGDQ